MRIQEAESQARQGVRFLDVLVANRTYLEDSHYKEEEVDLVVDFSQEAVVRIITMSH